MSRLLDIFRFGVEKICYMKEDADNQEKWDFEVHPKVFTGYDKPAVALKAEKHITKLANDVIDNIEVHEKICGKFLEFDPVGIHHYGCDEVMLVFENAIIRFRLVEMKYSY